jgi:hypothetical protein
MKMAAALSAEAIFVAAMTINHEAPGDFHLTRSDT